MKGGFGLSTSRTVSARSALRLLYGSRQVRFASLSCELRYSTAVRIGLIVYGDLEQVSGGNLYDLKLVEWLEAHDHEVDIVSLPNGSYARHLAQNFAPGLKRRLTGARYDVLVQDELVHPSLFRLNRKLRRDVDSPLVAIVHHLRSSEDRPDWQNAVYRRVERAYLSTVEGFVFNSHTTRESVETLLHQKTRNVVATPGGDRLGSALPGPRIEERALEGGPLRLLFVGNLIERKGLHVLLDALKELPEAAWTLDIVGGRDLDPGYARRLEARVDALGLGPRLTLHGALDGARLAERYRESQLLVGPSSYEGFGIVYLEAMSFGLPVIASRAGATDEIVRHESTGFLVPPGDPAILARQLARLIEDRDLLLRLSLEASQSFRQHPSWEASMESIETFLGSIASTD